MSIYSGKCDFYDAIKIYGINKILSSEIYINNKKLVISQESDLIPYYTHIISSSFLSKSKNVINLDEYSWLKREREQYGVIKSHAYLKSKLNEVLIQNNKIPLYSLNELNPNFYSHSDKYKDIFIIPNNKIPIGRSKYLEYYETEEKILLLFFKAGRNPNVFFVCETTNLDIMNIKNKIISAENYFLAHTTYRTTYDIEKDSLIFKEKKLPKNLFPKS